MLSLSRSHWLFSLSMLCCAVNPWLLPKSTALAQPKIALPLNWAFERWQLPNSALVQLPLTALEQRFAEGFPGAIGRFSDGKSIWVVRHVTRPTRLLHSAVDCYRGLGYQVSAPHVVQQANNTFWRCFMAKRDQQLQVCERIFDAHHSAWTDVSAWYWESLLQSKNNEWWALTQVTRATFEPLPMNGE